MNIGSNIKYLRQQNEVTQEKLADHLGVSYQAVSKWETNANTPDISLLPKIASFFGVTIDSLFADNVSEIADSISEIKDDDVIRIVQLRGTKIIDVAESFSPDCPPIEIKFPHDCNDRTQYFKVEVFGHVITDGSITGDVVCHKTIHCGTIYGDAKSEGDIQVNVINSMGKIICKNITDCYKLTCSNIECEGSVNSHIVIK
ncbi:MAG: helix-turn-helix transcriptional regulator [Clostridia bacterium]|nr:helix-turn-helix transcriptional regulator [Clostridia bacterium]